MFSAEYFVSRRYQQPFVPFRIMTISGQSYDATHPSLFMPGRDWLIVGTASEINPMLFEQANRVALMHITDLQDLPVPPATGTPGANGPTS